MKIKILSLIALIFSVSIFTACQKDDPDVEVTATAPVAGEWWVKYELETSPGKFEDQSGYVKLLTANTAENSATSMWIGDIFINPRLLDASAASTLGTFWTYMVKANVNIDDLSFNADAKSVAEFAAKPAVGTTPGKPAEPYDINVKITGGKIMKGGSVPPSGTTTDSISFNVEFEDDPGNVYRVTGYKRTGFLEDDH